MRLLKLLLLIVLLVLLFPFLCGKEQKKRYPPLRNVVYAESNAEGKELYDFRQLKHWHYDIKVEIIILMPDDFKIARDYYFDIKKHPKRDTYVAFTTWYRIKGELKPFMFLQTRFNLEPRNDDIGHEMKHVINAKHKIETGELLFAIPCDDWK